MKMKNTISLIVTTLFCSWTSGADSNNLPKTLVVSTPTLEFEYKIIAGNKNSPPEERPALLTGKLKNPATNFFAIRTQWKPGCVNIDKPIQVQIASLGDAIVFCGSTGLGQNERLWIVGESAEPKIATLNFVDSMANISIQSGRIISIASQRIQPATRSDILLRPKAYTVNYDAHQQLHFAETKLREDEHSAAKELLSNIAKLSPPEMAQNNYLFAAQSLFEHDIACKLFVEKFNKGRESLGGKIDRTNRSNSPVPCNQRD